MRLTELPTFRRHSSSLGVAALLLICAGGCSSVGGEQGDLTLARAVLANNPDVEVVATDERAGIFTLRVKRNGQIITVNATDVARGKGVPLDAEASPSRSGSSATLTHEPGAAGQTVTVGTTGAGVSVTAGGGAKATGQTVEVATPGRRVEVRTGRSPSTGVDDTRVTADGSPNASSGEVRVSTGTSGVSVTSDGRSVNVGSGGGGVTVSANGRTVTVGGDQNARVNERPATGSAGRRAEAHMCEAGQSLRIDNQTIRTNGPAVDARGGCQVIITNSTIRSSGVGILASGGSSVTIESSVVDGMAGAVDVSDGATVSASTSTLRGGIRKSGAGSFVDRGGNMVR